MWTLYFASLCVKVDLPIQSFVKIVCPHVDSYSFRIDVEVIIPDKEYQLFAQGKAAEKEQC